MKPFTRNHDELTVQERHGYGVVVLDLDGKGRELAHSVPLAPRQPVTASYSGVVDGLGRIQHAIGKFDRSEAHERVNVKITDGLDVEEIIKTYKLYSSQESTARKFGITKQTLSKILKEHGVTCVNKRTKSAV